MHKGIKLNQLLLKHRLKHFTLGYPFYNGDRLDFLNSTSVKFQCKNYSQVNVNKLKISCEDHRENDPTLEHKRCTQQL